MNLTVTKGHITIHIFRSCNRLRNKSLLFSDLGRMDCNVVRSGTLGMWTFSLRDGCQISAD
jgi:hypothetical protein